jgi:hypothetical protein
MQIETHELKNKVSKIQGLEIYLTLDFKCTVTKVVLIWGSIHRNDEEQ